MKKIDGILFKQMIISGANNLYNNYPEVDSLNVFPVPDGDTGTNMNLTVQSGVNEVFNKKSKSVGEVAKNFAMGLFMGAHGNSGVILSQIFKGFADALQGKEDVDAIELANAFVRGRETAYKAVEKPVEGTILTVIRESSEVLYEKAEKDMNMSAAMDMLLAEALKSLQHTPDLLPVLKEVGVIDSGGAGLCLLLEGFAKALHNKIVEKEMPTVTEQSGDYTTSIPTKSVQGHGFVQAQFNHEEFGYCTQFLLKLANPKDLKDKKIFNEKRFKAVLEAHGNSIVFSQIDDLVKVHIHTMKPGLVFTYAQQFGEFKTIKCDNMSEQHEELLDDFNQEQQKNENTTSIQLHDVALKAAATEKTARKKFALIAVAIGKGVENLFYQSSVDYIVPGGQTMNPSTADFVNAISQVNAEHIFIFPNNGNIVMAANQAAEAVKDKQDVIVIPTKSILEGLTGCMMFQPEATLEDNIAQMKENVANVKSGEVTYSIKDTKINGVDIKQGNYIAIAHKNIICCHENKIDSLMELIESLKDDESSMMTVLTGEDVSDEERDQIQNMLNEKYSDDYDIVVQDGGQPVYSFFASVE